MSMPEMKLSLVSNLWIKQMHFVKAGDMNDGHTHTFDHTTLLAKGKVRVNVDGVDTTFAAPAIIYIQKGKKHYLEALEDDVVAYCVHALRSGEREEDIIDPESIPGGITLDNMWNHAVNL